MSAARRRGATLAELAIALVLAGVAAALGSGLLLAVERRVRSESRDSRAAQTAREIAHVLGAELASAGWNPADVRGDTAIDLDSHVGASVVCAGSGSVVVLPSVRTSLGVPFTFLRQPPEAADRVLVWDTAGAAWRESSIDSVSFRGDGAGCRADGVFRSVADSLGGEPAVRMRLRDSLPVTIGPGAPVRVLRSGRWVLYRGGDRAWWLGYRRCPAGACGTVQPVAGPLASPADSGLRFDAAADGSVGVIIRAAGGPDQPAVVRRVFGARGGRNAPP